MVEFYRHLFSGSTGILHSVIVSLAVLEQPQVMQRPTIFTECRKSSKENVLDWTVGSTTPKINVKQSGILVVVLIVLIDSNTLAFTNLRHRRSFPANWTCCAKLRSKVECALNRVRFKLCCCSQLRWGCGYLYVKLMHIYIPMSAKTPCCSYGCYE